ncbi:hypothetical protein [Duganella sp. FT27W]|uniref:hypothetical protein n=1 Tax=Duganella sp. FT27W TaxID=2654636 RepID=UPI00128B5C42|nr:hypothetical protein [Duganella sp. FT27W]MPQ56376.1 hypothetical protein [Duganella sp. FT27W]
MNKPNFELLKDAYAIIYGIPAEVIDLDSIIKSRGDSLSCGTVACAFGWLGMHPKFKNLMNPTAGNFPDWVIGGKLHIGHDEAAAALFQIAPEDGFNLFSSSCNSRYDRKFNSKLGHKAMFLHRMESFLKERGEWKGLTKRNGSVPC